MSLAVDILERPVFLQPIASLHAFLPSASAESPYSGKARPFGKRAGFIHNEQFRQPAGLHRQFLPAAATAGSQNPAAVLGRHPGAETVHLAALTLLGLIRTEHVQHLSSISFFRACCPEDLQNSLNSISKRFALVKKIFLSYNDFTTSGKKVDDHE
jgi:hypothetical protein